MISVVSIVTTFILWLPFVLRLPEIWGIKLNQDGMATVVANYDGPYYIVAAKTLYNPEAIQNNFSFPLPPIYYSAHYPLFPILINAVATALPFLSYPYAMIVVTAISSILASWVFYHLLRQVGLEKQALWLTLLFLVLPARYLITRSVGSPEPLFILMILSSIYFFNKTNYWLAGVFGVFAQLTKSPGILLFFAYVLAILVPHWGQLAHVKFSTWVRKLPWGAYPLLLIPSSLVCLWYWYGKQYGSFFAYFNSGDNIHLQFPPFQVFNPEAAWVGTFWLEEIIWIYLFGGLTVLYLIKQKHAAFSAFAGVFLLSLLFVSHRDIARYSLPLVPFVFVAFSKVLSSREFRWVMLLLIIPIYLFAIAFIENNVTPVSDWTPLL